MGLSLRRYVISAGLGRFAPQALTYRCVIAGAGAYYFAKKSINADRAQRLEETQRKRRMMDSLEYSSNVPTKPLSASSMAGSTSSAVPSSNDAPVSNDFAG